MSSIPCSGVPVVGRRRRAVQRRQLSRGFTVIHPTPAFPSPVTPGGTGSLGFSLSFAPSRAGPGNARQGGDRPGHCLDYVSGISQPPLTYSLTTCDLTSHDQPFLRGHQCHPADRAWRVLAGSLPIYSPSHRRGAPDGGTKKYGPFRHESPWVYVRYGVAKGSAVELAWQVSPLDGISDRAGVGPVAGQFFHRWNHRDRPHAASGGRSLRQTSGACRGLEGSRTRSGAVWPGPTAEN